MGSTKISAPAAPPAPTYQDTMRGNLQAQIDLAPQLYASEATYQPKYAELEAKNQAYLAQQAMEQAKAMYPEAAAMEAGYQSALDTARLQRAQENLPQYISAFGNLMPGQADIIKNLSQQAVEQTAAGTSLTPEEQRSIEQQSRAGYAARGTALGQQSALSDVLNRYNYQQQRLGQRAQFASGVLGLQQQSVAPAIQAYYQQPVLQNAVGQAQQAGLAFQQAAGPALFNPESQMGFESAWVPYQAQMAQNLGQMQANATASAGRSSMFGSILGGVAGGLGAYFGGGKK